MFYKTDTQSLAILATYNPTGNISIKASAIGEDLGNSFRTHIVEQKDPRFVYAIARAVTADVPNKNRDMFPLDEIKRAYTTFIGRNIFLDHNTKSVRNAVGKIIAAELREDEEGQTYVACLFKIDRELHPDIAHKIENGIIDSVSMGANLHHVECSRCHHFATKESEFCDHLRNLGMYSDVYSISHGVEFTELSLVSVPADPTAKMHKVFNLHNGLEKVAVSADSTNMGPLGGQEKSVEADVVEEVPQAPKETVTKETEDMVVETPVPEHGAILQIDCSSPKTADFIYNFLYPHLNNGIEELAVTNTSVKILFDKAVKDPEKFVSDAAVLFGLTVVNGQGTEKEASLFTQITKIATKKSRKATSKEKAETNVKAKSVKDIVDDIINNTLGQSKPKGMYKSIEAELSKTQDSERRKAIINEIKNFLTSVDNDDDDSPLRKWKTNQQDVFAKLDELANTYTNTKDSETKQTDTGVYTHKQDTPNKESTPQSTPDSPDSESVDTVEGNAINAVNSLTDKYRDSKYDAATLYKELGKLLEQADIKDDSDLKNKIVNILKSQVESALKAMNIDPKPVLDNIDLVSKGEKPVVAEQDTKSQDNKPTPQDGVDGSTKQEENTKINNSDAKPDKLPTVDEGTTNKNTILPAVENEGQKTNKSEPESMEHGKGTTTTTPEPSAQTENKPVNKSEEQAKAPAKSDTAKVVDLGNLTYTISGKTPGQKNLRITFNNDFFPKNSTILSIKDDIRKTVSQATGFEVTPNGKNNSPFDFTVKFTKDTANSNVLSEIGEGVKKYYTKIMEDTKTEETNQEQPAVPETQQEEATKDDKNGDTTKEDVDGFKPLDPIYTKKAVDILKKLNDPSLEPEMRKQLEQEYMKIPTQDRKTIEFKYKDLLTGDALWSTDKAFLALKDVYNPNNTLIESAAKYEDYVNSYPAFVRKKVQEEHADDIQKLIEDFNKEARSGGVSNEDTINKNLQKFLDAPLQDLLNEQSNMSEADWLQKYDSLKFVLAGSTDDVLKQKVLKKLNDLYDHGVTGVSGILDDLQITDPDTYSQQSGSEHGSQGQQNAEYKQDQTSKQGPDESDSETSGATHTEQQQQAKEKVEDDIKKATNAAADQLEDPADKLKGKTFKVSGKSYKIEDGKLNGTNPADLRRKLYEYVLESNGINYKEILRGNLEKKLIKEAKDYIKTAGGFLDYRSPDGVSVELVLEITREDDPQIVIRVGVVKQEAENYSYTGTLTYHSGQVLDTRGTQRDPSISIIEAIGYLDRQLEVYLQEQKTNKSSEANASTAGSNTNATSNP